MPCSQRDRRAVTPALCLIALLSVSAPVAAEPITDPAALLPGVTLIDFESITTGGNLVTNAPNPLVIGDATFTSLTGTLSILNLTVAGWTANGTEVSNNTLFPGGEPDSAIAIDFARPIAQFLMGWGDPNFAGNVIMAFNRHGTLLETANVELGLPGGGHAAWIGISRDHADIARILVQPNQSSPSGDDYVIDNVYYVRSVPEPSTFLLLGVGLAALKGVRHARTGPGYRTRIRAARLCRSDSHQRQL
jgi:hypothetical protein